MILVLGIAGMGGILAISLVSKSILELPIILEIYEVIGQVICQIESILLRDTLLLMDRWHVRHKRVHHIDLALIEAGQLADILVTHIV